MKKLLGKKKFVAPMNSARDPLVCTVHRLFCWCEQYTDRQNQKETLLPKKKKVKTLDMKVFIRIQTDIKYLF